MIVNKTQSHHKINYKYNQGIYFNNLIIIIRIYLNNYYKLKNKNYRNMILYTRIVLVHTIFLTHMIKTIYVTREQRNASKKSSYYFNSPLRRLPSARAPSTTNWP